LTDQELQRIKAASQLLRQLIAVSRVVRSGGSSAAHEFIDAGTEAEQSMFMLVTGSGGTGKSRIIHCVRDFARRWHMANAMRVTATTGAAAANLQAVTWQSVVKDNFKKRKLDEVSEELRSMWSGIGLLIIDEISMAGAATLMRIDQHLQRLKSSKQLFGGVHLVVLGDFWQLGAVRQTPVYKGGSGSAATAKAKADADAGHKIWLQLTNGVELVTNMRASEDKPFAAILENLRVNQNITQQHLDTLNHTCSITPTRQPPTGLHHSLFRSLSRALCL
jgi:hypothetical protein